MLGHEHLSHSDALSKKKSPQVAIRLSHSPRHLHLSWRLHRPPSTADAFFPSLPSQSSSVATYTCGRPLSPGPHSARACGVGTMLACPHLPLRPPATVAARSGAKARRQPVPTRPLWSPLEGAAMALPFACPSPALHCVAGKKGEKLML